MLDSLRGLPETLQYGAGPARLQQMEARTEALSRQEERLKRTAGRGTAATQLLLWGFDLGMLFAAAALYLRGAVDFAGVLIPTIALMSSFGPVVALANLGATLQNTVAAGNRVLDILEQTPLVQDIHGQPDVTFGGAGAEAVTFGYGEETILQNVTVPVPAGQTIGLVGRSGSGKSTLLKLFLRFWQVDKGRIQVSGRSVEQINTENLRRMQAFVTQETHLFHDSIRNNLRIAKLDATDEELVAACRKASIHDWIAALPQGYDTPVGELGETLSGGERQRLGLALGAVGAALPLLPAFPFLLLAAYGFGKSSRRLDRWFKGTRLYRENLADLAEGRGLTRRAKIRIMVTVTLLMAAGFVAMHAVAVGRIVLGVVWVGHIFYFLFGVRTLPDDREETDD